MDSSVTTTVTHTQTNQEQVRNKFSPPRFCRGLRGEQLPSLPVHQQGAELQNRLKQNTESGDGTGRALHSPWWNTPWDSPCSRRWRQHHSPCTQTHFTRTTVTKSDVIQEHQKNTLIRLSGLVLRVKSHELLNVRTTADH